MSDEVISQKSLPQPIFGQIQSIKDAKEQLDQFMFLVWMPNPPRDNVRLILDDGTVKLNLKREKFFNILHELLQPRTREVEYNLFLIKESLSKYGGYFYYDRVKNYFKELSEEVDFRTIKPIDILTESRKQISIKETLADSYKDLHKEFSNQTKGIQPKPQVLGNKFNKFFSVLRNFTESKK